MPTSVNVTNLKINELKESQYDTAVQQGVIGENELSILTDVDAGQVIQVSTLPTASADELGNIYQFIGTTDANYTHGYFYECVSDGQQPATYSWSNVQVQAGGSSYTAGTGIDITNGTISVTSPTLQNTATASNGLTIVGTALTRSGINIGYGSEIENDSLGRSVVIGNYAKAGDYTYAGLSSAGNVAIGTNAKSSGYLSIAIGHGQITHASYAIQIGTSNATNSDENTFKVSNNNGNYEIMSADGTIPAARHASLPASDGTYVLKLVISGGVPTLSWVAE